MPDANGAPAGTPPRASRGGLLSAIEAGVALRPVPAPDERPVHQRAALDVTTELQQHFQRKRRQHVQQATAQEDEGWIANAQRTADRLRAVQEGRGGLMLAGAGALLAEAVQREAECPGDRTVLLVRVPTWRTDVVDDLQLVLRAVEDAQAAAAAAEDTAVRAAGGGTAAAMSSGPVLAPDLLQATVRRVLQATSPLIPASGSIILQAATRLQLSVAELSEIVRHGGEACRPLLQQLFAAAQRSQELLSDPGLRKFDRRDRATSAYRQYKRFCELCSDLDTRLRPRPALRDGETYAMALEAVASLRESFPQTIAVQAREGQWDSEEQVQLTPARQRPTPPVRRQGNANGGGPQAQDVSRALQRCDTAAAADALTALATADSAAVLANYTAFIRAAVGGQPGSASEGPPAAAAEGGQGGDGDDDGEALARLAGLDMLLSHPSCPSAAQLPSRDCQWLYAAVAAGSKLALGRLTAAGLDLNDQSTESQFAALHFAGRRGDLALVATLLRLGADPAIRDARGRSGTQVAAEWLKMRGSGGRPAASQLQDGTGAGSVPAVDRLDLGRFVCDRRFSDVTFKLDDGTAVPAHRVVLCGRSDFFKAMFESSEWAEAAQSTVPLPEVEAVSLRYALDYIYTGECLYPRGQLQVGCDLLRIANMLLLKNMQRQVEELLEEQLRADNAVAVAQQAYAYGAPRLLRQALAVALEHFVEVVRTGGEVAREALLGLLDDIRQEDLAVREHLRR
jgi:hypothetical protein